jgi:3-methyladenine DNA glycosylase AlkC
MAAQAASLKDMFGKAAVEFLAGNLAAVSPSFDAKRFSRRVLADLPDLELKARCARIADGIRAELPGAYEDALAAVLASLPPDPGPDAPEPMGGFRFMPLVNFVGRHGLEAPEASLAALAKLTRYFSAEFDIRPFILRHPALAMAHVDAWSRDRDWRVRRLASEGIRPRLPWAMRLPAFVADPAPVLRVLDRLCDDAHETVRRSVANNLNDIAKDHPVQAIAAARRWSVREAARRTVHHGLRTLVKAGHADALALLGFSTASSVAVEAFELGPRRIRLGQAVTFAAALKNRSKAPARLSIDYAVHHRKANGGTTAKVFKLAVRTLGPGESCTLEKRHAIRPITTRRYHAGEHAVALLVNGRELARGKFVLSLLAPR